MGQVGLRLIVYCKDGTRRGSREHTSFPLLGFTFRQRGARNRNGQHFSAFLPAVSKDAVKKIGAAVRTWRLHNRTGHAFTDLARRINPIVRGWMQYHGAVQRSALYQVLSRINAYLVRWIRKEYKRLRAGRKPSSAGRGSQHGIPACSRIRNGFHPSRLSGDQNDKSTATGDCHVGICRSPGCDSPGRPDQRVRGGS
ncbi:group II intron maturase-specific domain-containing protein [Rhodococcus jostii]|uniref:Group II intron, maturase-specific domain n=1 Tax=Rhodococcus jostii TaxID=132919 RepID=A0A1H4JE39_RHOJO|nr:group II intron maturase-specific domain-containing protein [Rhodococcus jostii]SEB44580.1 Group II intron, maturase-specific domain [Rhodococcus jostii]